MFVELPLERRNGSFRNRVTTSLLRVKKSYWTLNGCSTLAFIGAKKSFGTFERRCLTAIAVGSKLLACNFGCR